MYEKIQLFGKKKSRGSFDDFFSSEKFASLEEAYFADDYIKCDFVKDKNNILYVEIINTKTPMNKKYHKLIYQNCLAGIDLIDDNIIQQIAESIL